MADRLYTYPTNREFVRTIIHNKQPYRLRSVYDDYHKDYRMNVQQYLIENHIKETFTDIDDEPLYDDGEFLDVEY